jgi:hypothetical protein
MHLWKELISYLNHHKNDIPCGILEPQEDALLNPYIKLVYFVLIN